MAQRTAAKRIVLTVLNWLIGNCDLLGLPCQNWMWVFAVGLLFYIAALVIAGRWHAGSH
jgi:hypothetical protein